jgi:hypothetical protein
VQVDQQALSANKSKALLGSIKDKENAPVQLAASPISPKGSLSRVKSALNRSVLGANSGATNMMESLSISSSIDVDMQKEAQMAAMVCSLENKDACLSCGS